MRVDLRMLAEVPVRVPAVVFFVFFAHPLSLSLFRSFSFTLVSYTLLLLGEPDGGLVPRYREEQAGLARTIPSFPSLKTCARDQSVEGLRKRFNGVQTGDTGSFSQTSLTGRRPSHSIKTFSYIPFIYCPSVLIRSTAVLTRRNVLHDGQQTRDIPSTPNRISYFVLLLFLVPFHPVCV